MLLDALNDLQSAGQIRPTDTRSSQGSGEKLRRLMGFVLDAYIKAEEQISSATRIPKQHGWSEQDAGAESMRM